MIAWAEVIGLSDRRSSFLVTKGKPTEPVVDEITGLANRIAYNIFNRVPPPVNIGGITISAC